MSSSMRISMNERDFIEAAVHQGFRVDGRRLLDSRPLRITFLGQDGTVEVQQGRTRILAIMSAQLDAPSLDHPNEGSLAIFTEFSPMADPSFEPGRPRELAVELGRVIDRGLRQSRALDTESLCILTGDTVWALRLDLHVLDNCGNLLDAANAAALAALLSFQIPANILGGIDSQQEVIIDPAKVKELHPLTLHHWPVAVTFGFYGEGKVQLLDPNLKEEAAMQGRMTLTLNGHGEICSIQKAGGVGLTTKEIMSCLQVACTKASSMIDIIKRAVETHNEERVLRNASQYWNALHTIAADEIFEGTGKEHILTTLLSHENSFVEIGRPIKSKMVDIKSSDVSDEDDAYDIHLREELLDTKELANHLSAGCVVGQLKRNSDTSSGDLDTQTLSPHG
ncbi:hypothetical protein O6H91_Y320500 [Diphasiastrum complanatum]|nr:hypothetical protein O6H91_Y320500 [Diphasiastrum complanatum]